MARSAAQQLDRIFKQINDEVDNLGRSRRLRELGSFAAELIRKRTRKGFGVARPGGNRRKLKRLARSTIEYRTRYKKLLSSKTSPRKSNLTFTGQLLDSIKLKVTKGRVTIGPRGRRRDIFGRSSRTTNEQVAVFVSKDRPFMSLGKVEQGKLVDFYASTFERMLTRRGLTK